MKSLQEIRRQLKELQNYLRDNFSVDSIDLFGSYVRGDQNNESDLDVLVTFSEPNNIDLLKFIELRLFLKDTLGIDVDLVEKDTVKPRLRQRILREAVPV